MGALAASLAKPAKLNTLEKSKLDWNKCVSSVSMVVSAEMEGEKLTGIHLPRFVDKEDLSDSLTHARKDGYLEKQDFLQRTEDAREDAWEKSKSKRR